MDIPQLVTLAQNGDDEARAQLIGRAARLVYARVLGALGASAAAEDVAQDALLGALSSLPRLRHPRAFVPWLRRITDNTVADHFASRRRAATEAEAALDAMPARVGPSEALEEAEDRARVRAVLRRLPPRSRLAVELFYFHDLSCREVAHFLRVSHDAARAVLSRSRKELRRIIAMATPGHRSGCSWHTVLSGQTSLLPHKVLEWESDMQKLYCALYPAGDAKAAAESAGLSPSAAEEQLRFLEELRFVTPKDEGWRCTVPVVNDADGEMIRIWAKPIAQLVIDRLESLYQEASAVAELVDGDLAKATVTTIGLVEATRRPFGALEKELGTSAPERGKYGTFLSAAFTCSVPAPRELTGGFGCAHSGDDADEHYAYYFHPCVTKRPGLERLDQDFLPKPEHRPLAEAVLLKLAPFVRATIDEGARTKISDDLDLRGAQQEELWNRLVDLNAVREQQGGPRVALPVVPLEPWQDYLGLIEELKAEVGEHVANAADDLRARTLKCSFADCSFADTILAFFTFLEGLVKAELVARKWIAPPQEADFSWGTLIVA